MKLPDLIKDKNYIAALEILRQNKQLNSWIDGKTIFHFIAEEIYFYRTISLDVFYEKLSPDVKTTLIQALSYLYKIPKEKAQENLYSLSQAAYYKYTFMFPELIKEGFDPETKDMEGRTIMDIYPDFTNYFQKNGKK